MVTDVVMKTESLFLIFTPYTFYSINDKLEDMFLLTVYIITAISISVAAGSASLFLRLRGHQ